MATLNVKGFPDGLHRRLKARARRNRRSVAQEVTHILSEAVEPSKSLSVLDLRGSNAETPAQRDPPAEAPPQPASEN